MRSWSSAAVTFAIVILSSMVSSLHSVPHQSFLFTQAARPHQSRKKSNSLNYTVNIMSTCHTENGHYFPFMNGLKNFTWCCVPPTPLSRKCSWPVNGFTGKMASSNIQLSNRTPTWQIIENVYLQSPVPHPPEPLIDLVEQGDNWACFIPRSNTDVETFKKRNL